MRKTIGIALALCLAAAFFVLLDVERGTRRAEEVPAASMEQPSAGSSALVAEGSSTAEAAVAAQDGARAQVAEPDARSNVPEMRLLVRDAVDGRPIEDALATLHDRATPVPERTDEEGACVLPLALPGESVRLRVEAAGHFHWSAPVTCGPNVAVELARAATMHGRVLTADTGELVPGATLALLHQTCDGCEPERVVADERGEYELPSVPLRTQAGLETRAEGFATAWRGFELRTDETRVLQDVLLERGAELAGRVEDWISGRGIGGALVGHFVADAEGRFAGRVLEHGAQRDTTVVVRASGYASLLAVLDSATRADVVLRLPQLAFLEGRVTDAAGAPLVGAAVSVSAEGPARSERGTFVETSPLYELPSGWSYLDDVPGGKGDAEGRYRAAMLPWSIGCRASAGLRGFGTANVLFPYAGEPGSVRGQDWLLAPGERAFVRGKITLRGRGGFPVRGTVSWRGATRSGSARLDDVGGSYSVEVEPGEVSLTAVLDLLPALPAAEVVVRVPAGTTRSVDLEVEAPTATISGAVRFEGGTPAVGVEVEASWQLPGEEWASLFGRALTDGDGEYQLYVLDLGEPFAISTGRLHVAASPGARAVDFELRRGYRLFVRVREAASGRALVRHRDFQLLARAYPPYGFRRLEVRADRPDAGGWYESWLEEPEIDLLALPRGAELPDHGADAALGVRLDGSEPTRVELALARGLELSLALAEGVSAWPADHELLLVPDALHASIAGTRKFHSTPFDELAEQSSVRFDEHGRAVLRGLAPGSYRFKAIPADVAVEPAFVRLEPGVSAVAVTWSWAQ